MRDGRWCRAHLHSRVYSSQVELTERQRAGAAHKEPAEHRQHAVGENARAAEQGSDLLHSDGTDQLHQEIDGQQQADEHRDKPGHHVEKDFACGTEQVDKAFSRETRNMAASCEWCDGAWLWFGVHKQLSCQVSLVNASCHSQRGSLCPGVVGCCHRVKRFSGFTFVTGIEVTAGPDF